MALMPGATQAPLPNFSKSTMSSHDVVCFHTMVGSLLGTDGYFRGLTTGISSRYGTGGQGEKRQWGDTKYRSGANLNGNGYIISVECADMGPGFAAWDTKNGAAVPAFTAAQIEANAQILAWETSPQAHAACPATWACHKVGIPLILLKTSLPGQRGVAYHRLGVPGYMVAGGVQWSSAQGKVCPGDRRIAQIPQIIARAAAIRGGASLELGDDVDANTVVFKNDAGTEITLGQALYYIDRNIGTVIKQVPTDSAAAVWATPLRRPVGDPLSADQVLVWDDNTGSRIFQLVTSLDAKVEALTGTVKTLADALASTKGVDADKLLATVKDGLEGITLRLDVDDTPLAKP